MSYALGTIQPGVEPKKAATEGKWTALGILVEAKRQKEWIGCKIGQKQAQLPDYGLARLFLLLPCRSPLKKHPESHGSLILASPTGKSNHLPGQEVSRKGGSSFMHSESQEQRQRLMFFSSFSHPWPGVALLPQGSLMAPEAS